MPLFRETWHFRSSTGGTWNEVYYSSQPQLSTAADLQKGFLDARLVLAHPLNALQSVRISQTDSPRVTTIVQVNRPGFDPANLAAGTPYPVSVAAVINLASTVQPARRYLWLSGIDSADVSLDPTTGAPVVSPGWAANLRNWLFTLERNNYVIYSLVKKNPLDPFDYRVVSVGAADGSGRCTITFTAPGVGVLKGGRIILSRFDPKQYPGLKGQFTVLEVLGAVVTIQYTPPRNVITSPTTGQWRLANYQSAPVINANASGFAYLGERKRRNFFSNSRGAKSALRLRNLP